MQFLVNVVGLTSDALQNNDEEVMILKQSPVLKCRVCVPDKIKVHPNENVQKEKMFNSNSSDFSKATISR